MKDSTNKFPSFNQVNLSSTVQYTDRTPLAPIVSAHKLPLGVQGTLIYFGGSVAFFNVKKFFDPLVDMAKEYLAKHTQPDNIVNPLQPDKLKGEVVTVRSDN